MIVNNVIIASHSKCEAITKSIVSNKAMYKHKITVVLLHDLLNYYEIYDELNDNEVIVNWRKKNINISNKTHYLIGRVLYVPDELFCNFTSEDMEYAKKEFEAYIGFAFNAFTGAGNKTTNGISEQFISLPQQWSKIKHASKIDTPAFYWGPACNNPLKKSENIVYSDIFNFYNWRPNKNNHQQKHVFCFQKPPGQPIFVCSLGKKYFISSDEKITCCMKDRINELILFINNAFKYFIYEALIFADKNKIIFGCISTNIVNSAKNPCFDKFVYTNLLREFEEWIN